MSRAPLLMGFVRLPKGQGFWSLFLLAGIFFLIRFSKGALFLDAFSFVSRPFWPGPAQSEWIINGIQLEDKARLLLLEEDNRRLRKILELKNQSPNKNISAAVIARRPKGWWQQVELGKGKFHGVRVGSPVMGPGGLLGVVQSTTQATSRVQLLTAPGSRIGVWLPRTKKHGILVGLGTNRLRLNFLDKDLRVIPGDLVSTSPASTLMPPNIPVGVVQLLDNDAIPAPIATVQLMSSPEAIDWVQIQSN